MTEAGGHFDVAIVGGGPAGSSTAIRLALAGKRVVLIERKEFPREKLCGEFISPECFEHFIELGVQRVINSADPAVIERTVFYSETGRAVTVNSSWFGKSERAAVGLSRSLLDRKLLERAKDLGVTIRTGCWPTKIIHDELTVSGVDVRYSDKREGRFFAPIIIDATGRAKAVSQLIAQPAENRSAAKFIAFKTHLRNADISEGSCEIYVYPGGYGGCNSVEDGLVNICFVISVEKVKEFGKTPEGLLRNVLFSNVRARNVLQDCIAVKPWISMPIENSPIWNISPARGILAIGDAAAYIDPFTGSGILMALESGKIASEAILNSASDIEAIAPNYEEQYRIRFKARLRLSSLLRNAAFHPKLSEAMISILNLSDGVTRRSARATRAA